VNSAPHDTWIIKVRLADPAARGSLLDVTAYEALVKE
jgi:glycine cleavage system H lipoate-binding protein